MATQHTLPNLASLWIAGYREPRVIRFYDIPSDRVFNAVCQLEKPAAFINGIKSLQES